MPHKSLVSKAINIYSDEGFPTLLSRAWSYSKNRMYATYASTIEFFHQFIPSHLEHVSLNGVTVPVEIHPIDRYIPFYEPPYHTEDYPLYENTEVEALRTYATDGDDVVIIGGGFGVTAVVASRVTNGNITAFEPDKKRYEILERTIKVNGSSSNISINNAIVSEINASVIVGGNTNSIDLVSPTELPDADVFEIDCEGAETTILKTMVTRPSVILVETHDNHEEVKNILQDIGYDIIEVVKDGVGQHPNCTHIRAKISE